MRLLSALIVIACLVLAGCASVGDPLPPALNVPKPVTDLKAVQRGSEIVVTYTAPALTMENLGLAAFQAIDLRIADKTVQDITVPSPGESTTVRIAAAPWVGQDVGVLLRLSGPKGRWSPFSNGVQLSVAAPLAVPALRAETHPDGVRLSWPPETGIQYRIVRNETPLAVSGSGEYLDKTAQFGKEYSYTVQAFTGLRESNVSAPLAITPRDEFPPAAPKTLQAVAGLTSIELAWDRSPEADVASYRVYRNTQPGSEFAVLADALEGTAFSDRQIAKSATYRYRVTAVDRGGNESEPSNETEIKAP